MPFDPDAYLAAKPAPKGGFDPDAYLSRKPPPSGDDAPSWGKALSAAPGAALGEIGGAITGAGRFIASLPDDPLAYKIGRGIKALPGAVAQELGGMTQYVRNLSKPEYRGSAPTYEGGEAANHPWLAMTQGDTAPMRQAVAERPLSVAADAVMAGGLTAPGRAVIGKLADAGMAAPRKLVRMLADATPANRAENSLLEGARAGGGDPEALAAALSGNRSQVPGVRLSAAQVTQDPGLAAMERRSRTQPITSPGWANFDASQNTGLFNAMNGIVNPADDAAVEAARGARDAATKYHRQSALALADQGSIEPDSARFPASGIAPGIRDTAAWEMVGDRGVLPSVKKVAGWVLDSVPDSGVTAGKAYEVRKLLADNLNARAGAQLDELGSAVKSADVTSRILKSSIDRELDKASGGAWFDYLDAFKDASKDVNSTQALNNIRSDLQAKISGGAVDANGNPILSRAYINQIIEKHATNKYGDLIAPDVKGKLDAIRSTAQQIEAAKNNYRAAVTGGGSNTAHDALLAAGAGHAVSMLGTPGRVVSSLVRALGAPIENAGATRLGTLLQSQDDAAAALRSAAAREATRKAKKSSGVRPSALVAALSAQPQQQ